MINNITIFLLFYLYISSLNLEYLKLTKMELTRFAMTLFNYTNVDGISWIKDLDISIHEHKKVGRCLIITK